MDKIQIKDYILKYKDSYPEDLIKLKLLNCGASEEDIEEIYFEIGSGASISDNDGDSVKKDNSKLALFLAIFGLLLLLIGGLIVYFLVESSTLFPNKIDTSSQMLPNKIDISSPNIEPIVGDSFALGSGSDDGELLLAFKYNGVRPIEFEYDNTGNYGIYYDSGFNSCISLTKIYNADMGESAEAVNERVIFRTGHSGYFMFEGCEDFDKLDVIEGELKITYLSAQFDSEQTSIFGTLRLMVQS